MRKVYIAGGVIAAALLGLWLFAPGLLGLGGGDKGGQRGGQVPLITAGTVAKDTFVETIEAIGTARADESVTITAKTADTVGAINFTEGQEVEAGAILVEMTSTQQAADLVSARAELREAEKAYQRAADLVARGIAARASLDTATANRDAARGRVQAIEARLADTIVKAPFAGVVGLRNVSVGSYVSPGNVITTLDSIATIKGDFTIPERYLALLKTGLSLEVMVVAYPEATFKGSISSVDTRIDPVTRAITVRAELPNPDRRLKPGMLMSVSLLVGEHQAIAVPESALVSQGDKRYVFLIDGESKAQRVEVKTGLVKPGSVEILAGLKEGDRIVTQGTNKVIPGQPVRVSDAPPANGGKPVAETTAEGRS